MTAVTLTVVQGSLHGTQYRFEAPCTVDIGRGEDCQLRFSAVEWGCMISRHHCRLEVHPPTLRLCDMGSKNGTFVNGVNIGRRLTQAPSEECPSGACELRSGDHIALGALVLRVELDAPAKTESRWILSGTVQGERTNHPRVNCESC